MKGKKFVNLQRLKFLLFQGKNFSQRSRNLIINLSEKVDFLVWEKKFVSKISLVEEDKEEEVMIYFLRMFKAFIKERCWGKFHFIMLTM